MIKNKNIFEIFSSRISCLEITYVLGGIKPCCRLLVQDKKKKELQNFCKENGLYVEFSDYKVSRIPDNNKLTFSNRMRRIPLTAEEGEWVVYISKSKEIAELAKHSENILDHAKFGELLGYPKCCTNFYIKNREKALENNDDYNLLIQPDIKKHPFYNNHTIRCFGISLISHFPCSHDCKQSKKVAEKTLHFLKKENPGFAEFFEDELKALVVYTGNNGVFYSPNYKKEGNIIFFNSLKSTVDNDIFHKLTKERKIKINPSTNNVNSQEYHQSDIISIFMFE